jgi:hypothetical protein
MKRSCCEERQKRGQLLSAAIAVAEKMELKLTPGRIRHLRFTIPLIAMVSYSKLKICKVIGSEHKHKGALQSVPMGVQIFLFFTELRLTLEPRPPSYPEVAGSSFLGVKWPGLAVDHSLLSGAEVLRMHGDISVCRGCKLS